MSNRIRTASRSAAALVLALAALASVSPARAAEKAGVSAAVRGQVALTRNERQVVGRQVETGEDILLRDEISSSPRSGMQVLLLDETVFTIGPESTIVIDEFVYDPATGAGEVGAEVVKGVFRFVTGRIAAKEPEKMEVELPVGNIGIRGTMVGGIVRPDGSAVVFLLGAGPENDLGDPAGAFEATNEGISVWVRTPGWGVEFYPGEPPRLVRVDPDLVAEVTAQVSDPSGEGTELPPVATASLIGFEPGETSGHATAEGEDHRVFALDLGALDETTDEAIVDAVQTQVEEFVEMQRVLATVDQLLAVPGGLATYTGSSVLSDGGGYDFSIDVDFDFQVVVANLLNIASPNLGLTNEFSFGSAPFSSGQNGLADFAFSTSNINASGACSPCTVDFQTQLFNAGSPPRISDHSIQIQDMVGNTVTGGASDVPLANFGPVVEN